MGWGRRWPERRPRPKARRLTKKEQETLLATMVRGVAASPVLSALGVQVRLLRGRFYIERPGEDPCSEADLFGRITPLAGAGGDLLLEAERGKGNWFEVAKGKAPKLIRVIAGDTKGTFHGLGVLDKSLRSLDKEQDRLLVRAEGKGEYVYADSGEQCSAQEALYHYFGVPISVVAEPSNWYWYHRTPWIVEVSEDRTRVLVRFTAMSLSGASFGGTCLYAQREGRWGAYPIKPSESGSIAQAVAWLVKRKWRAW